MAQRRSAQEWSKLLELYASKDCSEEQFCKRHEIAISTLKYHLAKASPKRAFSPILSVVEGRSAEVIVDFPCGVRLSVRG